VLTVRPRGSAWQRSCHPQALSALTSYYSCLRMWFLIRCGRDAVYAAALNDLPGRAGVASAHGLDPRADQVLAAQLVVTGPTMIG
jgi:hypothetical protein